MKPILYALLPALVLSVLSAQDPTPPAGGFDVRTIEYAASNANGPITWVDGVRTELDIDFPIALPPASGWPSVLLMHGGSGTRKNPDVQALSRLLASMGYVCLRYDDRGDGATVVLNPPGFAISHADKLRDMANAIQLGPTLLPVGVTMDGTRVAVTGESQGGRHAYRAAAWSGLALPLPFGSVTHMPVIAAIAPRVAPLSPADDTVQQGILMNAEDATKIYQQPTSPSYSDLLAEDYAAIYSATLANPLQHFLPQLLTSTVPTLIGNVWTDAKHQLAPTVDALALLPATLPHRVVWSTHGHSTPKNQIEQNFTFDLTRRWFDRYLKSIVNGVEAEPFAEVAVQPADPVRHGDPSSGWGHVLLGAWPPRGTTSLALYLRGAGTLTPNPPATVEVGPTIQHRVLNGYGIANFCQDDRRPSRVLPNMPLVRSTFTGQTSNGDLEILGRPRVQLEVDASTGDFYLQAALLDVDPLGNERFVCAGSSGVRGGNAGRHALTIELDDTAYVLPAGHQLRLSLENLPLHRPPTQTYLRWVPCFTDSDATVVIDPAAAPRLDLPGSMPPHALLSPRLAVASAAAGITVPMLLEASPQRAGDTYLVLTSASGIAPGCALPPVSVPLNIDTLTLLAAGVVNLPPFVAFAGTTDGLGTASPNFAVGMHPAGALLIGQRWAFAVVGLGANGFWASGPSELTVVP